MTEKGKCFTEFGKVFDEIKQSVKTIKLFKNEFYIKNGLKVYVYKKNIETDFSGTYKPSII